MVVVSYSGREINAKLVYYGTGLSGKTTNLEFIYSSIPSNSRGKMVSMKTQNDRTLFFDLLPVDLGEISGFKTRFMLYTVPGQVFYNATRKLVLRGSDALVFVADSERGKMDENLESLQNLEDNLREYNITLDQVPWVIQYNKRDLPSVYSVEELNRALNPRGVPWFEAVALKGDGVFETFRGVSRLLLDNLSRELKLGSRSSAVTGQSGFSGSSALAGAAGFSGPLAGTASGATNLSPRAEEAAPVSATAASATPPSPPAPMTVPVPSSASAPPVITSIPAQCAPVAPAELSFSASATAPATEFAAASPETAPTTGMGSTGEARSITEAGAPMASMPVAYSPVVSTTLPGDSATTSIGAPTPPGDSGGESKRSPSLAERFSSWLRGGRVPGTSEAVAVEESVEAQAVAPEPAASVLPEPETVGSIETRVAPEGSPAVGLPMLEERPLALPDLRTSFNSLDLPATIPARPVIRVRGEEATLEMENGVQTIRVPVRVEGLKPGEKLQVRLVIDLDAQA